MEAIGIVVSAVGTVQAQSNGSERILSPGSQIFQVLRRLMWIFHEATTT